ncbi:MAG: hypothetical protein AB2693_11710, partial [Candidatus Thiodiazotropha sp.]
NFTSSDKTQITVLACMNATGYYLKPLIVYPGERFSYNPLEGFPDAVLGRTVSGWMDKDLFATWLKDVFLPGVKERGIKLPVVLFVDGHSTHGTLEASTFCRENNIILYCLLEHASHIIQPCDLRLFSAMKESWKKSVRDYQIENIGEYVTKAKFAQVFKCAWEKATTVEISVKAFRDSGLFPLDARKPLSTLKMEPSKIFSSSSKPDENNNVSSSNEQLEDASEAAPTDLPVEAHASDSDPQTAPNAESNSQTDSQVPVPTSSAVESTTDQQPAPVATTSTSTLSTPSASTPAQPSGAISSTSSTVLLSPEATVVHNKSDDVISSAFSKQLALPTVKKEIKKKLKTRIQLPKAISGKKFNDLLLERKRKKEEEEAAKEARKAMREEQKLKRQQEKEQKQKEREEKKKQKELEKKKKATEAEAKKILKELSRKRKRSEDSESNSNDETPVYDDDEMNDIDVRINSASCYACGQSYDNKVENWVMCNNCPRWLHRACVSTIDLLSMSEEDIADLEFECDYC